MKLLLFIILFLPNLVLASDITLASDGDSRIPVDAITVRATHVAVAITANADNKGVIAQWQALDKFKQAMQDLAQSHQHISVERVASSYNYRNSGKLFGSYDPSSNYRIRVFSKITEDESIITAIQRLESFVGQIKQPKSIEFRHGSYSLAIQGKESYQAQLLAKVQQSINRIKLGLGEGYRVKLDAFLPAIRVQQNGEDTVALYYSYKLNFEQ